MSGLLIVHFWDSVYNQCVSVCLHVCVFMCMCVHACECVCCVRITDEESNACVGEVSHVLNDQPCFK